MLNEKYVNLLLVIRLFLFRIQIRIRPKVSDPSDPQH
jgi:hypothetical protein